MKFLRNIFTHLYVFVLWFLASALIWGWIFTFVTDTTPARKVTVYCRVPAVEDTALAYALEQHMPEGLRMIQVHNFSYVMFDTDSFDRGDIFIVPASEDSDFVKNLLPLEDGQGTQVYEADTGEGIATDYIQYGEEDYYLYLGSGSVHLEDGTARAVAEELLSMRGQNGENGAS